MRIVFLLLSLVLTAPAFSADPPKSGRRYDKNGKFDGTYRETRRGHLRLYDENGKFEGTVRPDRPRRPTRLD